MTLPGHLSLFSSQVSWALGALSAGGARTQLPEGQQGPPAGCSGRLLELKGKIGFGSGAVTTTGWKKRSSPRFRAKEPICWCGPNAGNIRVLCRLRPAEGIPSSLVSVEPGQGGTITTCYRGRQHRFRLDWVFPPDASQEEVTATFTSVLTLPQSPLGPKEARSLSHDCLSTLKVGGWVPSVREGSR